MKSKLFIFIAIILHFHFVTSAQIVDKKDALTDKVQELIYEIKCEFTGNVNSNNDSVYSFFYVFNKSDLNIISQLEINKTIAETPALDKIPEILSIADINDSQIDMQTSGEFILRNDEVYLKAYQPGETPFFLTAKSTDNKSVKLLYKNEKGEIRDREKDIQDYLKFLARQDSVRIIEKFDVKKADKDEKVKLTK